jgi:hypothetical protein
MRKLVVTENITLDGVIDMAEGWFDPLNEDVDQSDITAGPLNTGMLRTRCSWAETPSRSSARSR